MPVENAEALLAQPNSEDYWDMRLSLIHICVELGNLGSTLCGLAGLFGLGTDGGQRFTQGALFRCGFTCLLYTSKEEK